MCKLRFLSSLIGVTAVAAVASANFDGVAPLAWRWAQPSKVAPAGSPIVQGNFIYIGVGTKIYALDTASGNEKWHFPMAEPVDGYFRSTPIYVDGTVIAATQGHTIYGVDALTGQKKWSYEAKKELHGQPVLAGKFVVVNTGGDELMAVSVADGKPAWKETQRVFDGVRGTMAAYGDNLFFFNQSEDLYRMSIANPKDAKLIARFSRVSSDVTPTVSGSTVYVNSSGYVVALNALTGSTMWQSNTGEDLILGPAISTEGIGAVTRDGKLLVMDLRGRLKRTVGDKTHPSQTMEIDLGASAAATPAAVGKLFVVPTTNGSIEVIDPNTGAMLWNFVIRPMSAGFSLSKLASEGRAQATMGETNAFSEKLTVPAANTPVVAGDTLLVLAADGSLLAFDKNFGVDLTGPNIHLGWPSAGAQMNGKDLELIFSISDEATGVEGKSVKVQVNGKDVDFDYGRDGIATVFFGDNEANGTLEDGRAEITVTAKDYMGNVTTEHFSLFIDHTLRNAPPPVAATALPPRKTMGGKGGGGGKAGGG